MISDYTESPDFAMSSNSGQCPCPLQGKKTVVTRTVIHGFSSSIFGESSFNDQSIEESPTSITRIPHDAWLPDGFPLYPAKPFVKSPHWSPIPHLIHTEQFHLPDNNMPVLGDVVDPVIQDIIDLCQDQQLSTMRWHQFLFCYGERQEGGSWRINSLGLKHILQHEFQPWICEGTPVIIFDKYLYDQSQWYHAHLIIGTIHHIYWTQGGIATAAFKVAHSSSDVSFEHEHINACSITFPLYMYKQHHEGANPCRPNITFRQVQTESSFEPRLRPWEIDPCWKIFQNDDVRDRVRALFKLGKQARSKVVYTKVPLVPYTYFWSFPYLVYLRTIICLIPKSRTLFVITTLNHIVTSWTRTLYLRVRSYMDFIIKSQLFKPWLLQLYVLYLKDDWI